MITIGELQNLAREAAVAAGDPLSGLEVALIRLGVTVSVTSLDRDAIQSAVTASFSAGATPAQIQEILSLVSGLGVHSLMATSVIIVEQARAKGFALPETLTADEQALWDKYVGNDPFWIGFERELPGFLHAMLIMSSDQFKAFFDYCSVPWKSGQVRGRIKELTAMACDATPTHRFLPGFRVHLTNAITLGAGHLAIDEALAVAAAAPEHQGTR